MKRRTFVALGAAGLTMAVSGGARAQPAPREDIQTFSRDPVKVAALRLAFEKLGARSPDQLVGWFNYAAIHGVPSNDPIAPTLPVSMRTYWRQCHRDEGQFFIWHRAYLAALERNLQTLSGMTGLRLPYWDWYKDPTLPTIFRGEFLDAARTRRNPLYDPRRDAAVQAGQPVWTPASSGAIDQPGFREFQADLGGSEHGDIHVGVGGWNEQGGLPDMGRVPTAARDPIFWLHHCNIDRLLTAWISRGRAAPDQSAAFDAAGYKFPLEGGADFTPKAAALDMNSRTPLGQAYESLDAPFVAPPPRPVTRPPVTRRVGAGARSMGRGALALNPPTSVAVPAQGLSVEIALPAAGDRRVRDALNAPLARATSVVVVLDNVTLEQSPKGLTGYDVFLNLPGGSTANPAPYKIGAISLFNLTMDHDHEAPMAAPVYRFQVVRQVRARGGLTSSLIVTLVPRYGPRADTAANPPSIRVGDLRVEVSANPVE